MNKKTVYPVLIEIQNASNIFENKDGSLSYYEHKQHASSGGKKFELILISLDKEERVAPMDEVIDKYKTFVEVSGLNKVVARQHQLPIHFIETFIEEYNDGVINFITIEYEEPTYDKWLENGVYYPKPKLINNKVVIIESDPHVYTKEEVLSILEKYDNAKWGCSGRKDMDEIIRWFNKTIQK